MTEDYTVPFKFTGKIAKVTVELEEKKAMSHPETEHTGRISALWKALAD